MAVLENDGTGDDPGYQFLASAGDSGARAVDIKTFSEQKPAQKMKHFKSWRQHLRTKSESRRQEETNWDEDIIEDTKGLFGKERVFWKGSLDSQGFPRAPAVEVRDIFRHCVRILGAYGDDIDGLRKPIREHEPQFDSRFVVDVQRPKAAGACPPYFIYVDHQYKEVSMYIRGLNLLHRRDYVVLLRNRKGEKPYEEGFVHHGMSEPAEWATEHVAPVLKEQLRSNKGYRLTIVGHSLGAGVAALFTMLVVKNPELVGLANSHEIRAILFAPPRVMSVDLAIKYAPYINSVIYQDDFLPRVSTKSVKRVFLVAFPLTIVVIFTHWLKQALEPKDDKEKQRLYPPGKVYHFVYKQPGRRGTRPIRARVVPSAQGKFERIVFPSLGTASNHSVLLLAKHLKEFDWPEELKDPWLTSVLQTRKK